MSPNNETEDTGEPSPSYLRRLLVFLSVATFFEGYDFFAITQILPNLRQTFGLLPSEGGKLIAVINAGTILAYLLIRKADRWGRKKLLTITIAGYCVLTFLSGFAPNAPVFAVLQMLARIFLIGEWAISMVIAAEEFPKHKRGTAIGIVSACAGLGSVVCAGIVPLLLKTPFGFRAVYFVSLPPLLLLAFARRGLRETRRFTTERSQESRGLFEIWRTPQRRRLIELGLIWFVTYICTQNAVTFWKEFAVHERGLNDAQVGLAMTIAALGSMPIVFFSGKLLDIIGRKPGAALIFGTTAVGAFGAYTAHSYWLLTGSLFLGMVGVNSVLTVMNAFTTELFETEWRGAAFAWSNNLIGRIGYCLSPLAVGASAEVWGWGGTLRATAIFPLIGLALILLRLPETRGKDLKETAKVAA